MLPLHPQEFRNIADHLYDTYCALNEEAHRLRKENKALTEELNKIKNLNTSLSARLNNLSGTRILKMGAEWFLDGEFLLNMCLTHRIRFNSPICNAKISKEGKIAFTCNNKIFLIIDKNVFVVEDTIKSFDMKTMKHDLVDLERRIFDFIEEDLVVYDNGRIIKFNNQQPGWVVNNMMGVTHICVDQRLIYVGMDEGKIQIYNIEGVYKDEIVPNVDFTSFIVKDSRVLLVSQECITLQPSFMHLSSHRIVATDFDGNAVYHGGTTGVVSMALPSGNTLQSYDSLNFKSPILSLLKYKGFLLVATEDRMVNVTDLTTKKSMRIVQTDNVIDMCCNENVICFVDNNGGLKEWRIKQ
ncbi:uncharacterized protein VICG_01837 [Vittaforma corneae ATCC 50505]|uniref:Uncharacterized protein n=1 Tax=Vittaforma corneae (strain ATCC 50505) TaxID=993615 RepID=L2GJU3_VITCO|nr:uncharacterized protein VICG_01837 [Vittaforma corneae ATCC 50505]ELA41138.1 hypothetical protein VICG_01837 [Vittaforma corneae ATCC 50505]